jgi:hypothetical protein
MGPQEVVAAVAGLIMDSAVKLRATILAAAVILPVAVEAVEVVVANLVRLQVVEVVGLELLIMAQLIIKTALVEYAVMSVELMLQAAAVALMVLAGQARPAAAGLLVPGVIMVVVVEVQDMTLVALAQSVL